MSWFAVVLPLVIMAFVAVMMILMPSITRATLPLGVSIPQQRIDEPVVREAVKRYRWSVGIAFAASAVVTLVLAGVSAVAAVIVPVLLQLVLSIGAYSVCRRSIQQAKVDGHWYQDVPVRLSGTITATPTRVSTPIGWYLAGAVLLAAVAAWGVSIYDSLPDTVTTHWNAAGVADGFAPKSVWSVFGPLLIGLAMVAFLFSIARLTSRIPMRRVADYSAEQQLAMQDLMQQMVGQIALALAALLGAISLLSWFAPNDVGLNLAVTLIGLVLLFAAIAVFLVRQRKVVNQVRVAVRSSAASREEAGTPSTAAPRADTPDDDRYWKGGMFYLNRNDPALWVPKRFGVGWTVNLGHPAGIAIIVIPVLIIIGVAIFATGVSPR